MTLALLASFGVAIAAGLLLTRGFAFRTLWTGSQAVLVWSLAVALGLGAAGCGYFLWVLLFGPTAGRLAAVELAILVLAVVAVLRVSRTRPDPVPETMWHVETHISRWLAWSFGIAATCAAGAFVALSLRNPHGGWDAWMTWNLHARFVFRGGDGWRDMFSDTSPLRHPDYPFLLPSLVARGWSYAGAEVLGAPVVLAFLFTLATLGVVCGALAKLHAPDQGLLAGLVLVSTPFFVTHGASQYADLPVGLYLTIALALICIHDRTPSSAPGLLVLAGLALGLAAWTKNEGLMFAAALVTARTIVRVPREGWRAHLVEMRAIAAGLLPVLCLVLLFKLQIAPANDLVSSSAQGVQATLDRLTDPGRYLFVAKSFTAMVLSFGDNGLVGAAWLLLTYAVCLGVDRSAASEPGVRTGVVTLALIVAGHGLVYLSAPQDMPRLLDGSLERVFLQLWPGFLLMFFMIVRSPGETSATPRAPAATARKEADEIGQAA